MNPIEIAKDSWGWAGINPIEIIDINPFGNLILKDSIGKFWRICPEELECIVITDNDAEYAELTQNQEFLDDWEMDDLLSLAQDKLGIPDDNECYCFKKFPALGGDYSSENLGKMSISELIRYSGELAFKIKDLPDGAEFKIDWEK